MRTNLLDTGIGSSPAIVMQGAFQGGGSAVGMSHNIINRFELQNLTTRVHTTIHSSGERGFASH